MSVIGPGVLGINADEGSFGIHADPHNGRLTLYYTTGDGVFADSAEIKGLDIDVLCGMLAHYTLCKNCQAKRATEDVLTKAMNPDHTIG